MKNAGRMIALSLLLSQAACATDTVLPGIPARAGSFDNDASCRHLMGRYMPKGECLSAMCSSQSSLLDVLGTRYPPPGTAFNKDDDRHVDLFFEEGGAINAKVTIGKFNTNWEANSFVCDQGWLKLSRRSEGGSEGNDTQVEITSYLRKNTEGDLIVFQTVKGRTTNLFGLVRASIDDSAWLRFKRVE